MFASKMLSRTTSGITNKEKNERWTKNSFKIVDLKALQKWITSNKNKLKQSLKG